MASENAPRDDNFVPASLFEIDGSSGEVMPGQIDQITGRILVDLTGGGSGNPAPPDTSIQFNDGGSFGGDAGLTWDKAFDTLQIGAENTNAFINAPNASTINAAGGGLIFTAGSANGDVGAGNDGGGYLTFDAGNADTVGNGGGLVFSGGLGGVTSGKGGSISIDAGSAQGGDSDGGVVNIFAGASSGAGTAGTISIGSAGGNILFDTYGGGKIKFTNQDSFAADIDTSLLSDNRTYFFPDQNGVFVLYQSFINNEVVAGSGTIFTLENTPNLNTEHLYGNGSRLIPTVDYTIVDAVITTINSFDAGTILADYMLITLS